MILLAVLFCVRKRQQTVVRSTTGRPAQPSTAGSLEAEEGTSEATEASARRRIRHRRTSTVPRDRMEGFVDMAEGVEMVSNDPAVRVQRAPRVSRPSSRRMRSACWARRCRRSPTLRRRSPASSSRLHRQPGWHHRPAGLLHRVPDRAHARQHACPAGQAHAIRRRLLHLCEPRRPSSARLPDIVDVHPVLPAGWRTASRLLRLHRGRRAKRELGHRGSLVVVGLRPRLRLR